MVLRDELARVLLESWDPLGVADIDVGPASEYRHEADRLLELLRAGVDEGGVEAALRASGISRGPAADRAGAAAVMAWWHRTTDRARRPPGRGGGI